MGNLVAEEVRQVRGDGEQRALQQQRFEMLGCAAADQNLGCGDQRLDHPFGCGDDFEVVGVDEGVGFLVGHGGA